MADKRFGAVVVFKEGMSRPEVQRALLRLADDAGYAALDWDTRRAFERGDGIEKFDSDEGGPVWYIP